MPYQPTAERRNRLFNLRNEVPHEVYASVYNPKDTDNRVPRVENLEDFDLSLEELREVLDEKEQE